MMSRSRFVILWTLATMIAWSITFPLLFIWDVSSYGMVAGNSLTYVIGLTTMGVAIGFAQGFVLNRVWVGGLYWFPATAGATLLGALLAELLFQFEIFGSRIWLGGFLVLAPLVFIGQYWIIRRAKAAMNWLFFKLLALIAGGIVLVFLILFIFFLAAIPASAVLGLITALGMWRIIRPAVEVSARAESDEQIAVIESPAPTFPADTDEQPAVPPGRAPEPIGFTMSAGRKRTIGIAFTVTSVLLIAGIFVVNGVVNQPPARPVSELEITVQDFALPNNAGSVEMVNVPAGTFLMGTDDYWEFEGPQHEVYLDAYWIDRLEVSNAQYALCVSAGGCASPTTDHPYHLPDWRSYADPDAANLPIANISWQEAADFCAWRGARLPTEAEWEKAARGTDGRLYPWGDTFYAEWVNFCDVNCNWEWGHNRYDDGYSGPAPVDAYTGGASPYGTLNMLGNVSEWVADWYADDTYLEENRTNPQGPATGNRKVIRGQSCRDELDFLGVARRDVEFSPPPAHIDPWLGFRCAVSDTAN